VRAYDMRIVPLWFLHAVRRILAVFLLFGIKFPFELARANVKVAKVVALKCFFNAPLGGGILLIELPRILPRWAVVLYANLITLTPGTITLEVDPALRYILVHCLCITNAPEEKESLRTCFLPYIERMCGYDSPDT
jgi:multicomponent Na+:H+ antiporter subunit E